jgi:hypothetical protein
LEGVAHTAYRGPLGWRGLILERSSWLLAVALSGALATGLFVWDPHVRDLAAHAFRAELFERDGFSIWNGSWYGGHYLLTHSVLFPPLAALLGGRLVAAVAVVWSAYLFDRLVRTQWGERARPATAWYAVGAVTMLASGRLSFALGVAVALASLRALQRGWAPAACAGALVCPLVSPVAAVFLAGVLTVAVLADRERTVLTPLATAAAALVPIAALNLLFGDESQEPFSFSAWIALPLWCAAVLYLTRGLHAERALRAVVGAYLAVSTVIWLVPNPLGGNATRLGALFGGPVLLAVLLSRRVRVGTPIVALVLAGSAWWQLQGAVRDVARSFGDPSTRSTYYEPLADWLRVHGGQRSRIEIPFTSSHWETARLAPEFELARGWLRQLDRARNSLFYEGRLTHDRYRGWLHRNGVRYVAVPDADPDYSAEAERALIASKPSYLRPRASLAHWRIYEVPGAHPLVESAGPGRARLVAQDSKSFVLAVSRPGRFTVRVRSSPFWTVSAGRACVGQEGSWTLVRADQPGRVRVSIGFSLERARRAAIHQRRRC